MPCEYGSCKSPQQLLPLNRSRWLGSNVIDHAVYALYFIHNPRGDIFQYFVRQRNPIGGHAILGTHRADRTGIRVSSHVPHYAHRHDWKQHRKRLPDLGIEAGILDFADHNVVTFAQQRQSLRRYFAEHTYRQPGTGERLPLQDFLRYSEVPADFADLIFEQIFQRLDQLQLHFLRQAAYIVVRLDYLRRASY